MSVSKRLRAGSASARPEAANHRTAPRPEAAEHRTAARPAAAEHRADPPKRRDAFYLVLTCAMTATVFLGFSFTYFGPLARGAYPEVSPLVHVHGWTFFAWYVLLPLQAGLVRSGKRSLHRNLGLASTGLGALMITVGLVVSLVQSDKARAPDGDPFWQFMGVPIFGSWLLFTGFYVAAMRRRRRVEDHKRLIVLASAVALGAATFRIVVRIAGFAPWIAIVGMLAAVTFPLIAMVHDRYTRRTTHPIYAWGVTAMVLMIVATFLVGVTPAGGVVQEGLGRIGRVVRPLYLAP